MLTAGEHAKHDLTLTGPQGWTFDARLVEPADDRSGITVLLIGGGIGNDLDWTVPGSVEVNGTPMQLTLDGTTHRDAPRIAQALADQGHAVMHYSTIAHEDPKRDRWPLEMTPPEVTDLLLLQRTATRAIQVHPLTRDDRVVLLGHSMGAQRACAQAADDPAIQALVLLGPAQMTRTGPNDLGQNLNRAEAHKQLAQLDRDGNGKVTGDEIPASMDFDQDGTLRAWEVSATLARKARRDMKPTQGTDKPAIPFGEDSLQNRPVPTLILYGNLDEAQGYHAPILQDLVAEGSLKTVEVRVLPGLGHQLGPERDDRVGPISNVALTQIVEWLETRQADPEE
ncbi:MAG: alpha/beta fold hydrolase [Planctomycetota bacterium]|nr:alpha/beta fold hydrolase [Planctomycetota bacterium]